MVTITVDTGKELDKMMDYAQNYVCEQRSFHECGRYPGGGCDQCFADNHIKCGIRIILSSVDNSKQNKL